MLNKRLECVHVMPEPAGQRSIEGSSRNMTRTRKMGEDFEDSKRSPWIHLNPCIHEFMIFMIVKNKDTYKESQIRG